MYYQAMMCALKEKKGGCCLRWGDTGALRLSGETSLEEDTAGAGFLGQNMLGGGETHNDQVHPLRTVGRQRAREPPGGVGRNGRSHLPSSFCVLAHCSLALGQRGQYL